VRDGNDEDLDSGMITNGKVQVIASFGELAYEYSDN
jgi:hypothetical protein